MCGIAGFSVADEVIVDRPLLANLLLAGVAERGHDASGIAWRGADGEVRIVKQPGPARNLLTDATFPTHATEILLHVRKADAGSPDVAANNHPIRYGQVCGAHVGLIRNADDLFERFARERSHPDAVVDSEAIFMLLDSHDDHVAALEHLDGPWTIAYFDRRAPEDLRIVAGGPGMYVGIGRGFAVYSSTRLGLEFVREHSGLEFEPQALEQGTSLSLRRGAITSNRRFALPSVEMRATPYDRDHPLAVDARTIATRMALERRSQVRRRPAASPSGRGRGD